VWLKTFAASLDDKDRVTRWQALVEFANGARQARTKFQKQVLDAIHAPPNREPDGC